MTDTLNYNVLAHAQHVQDVHPAMLEISLSVNNALGMYPPGHAETVLALLVELQKLRERDSVCG